MGGGGGGEGVSNNGLYKETPPKRGTFIKLKVNKRVTVAILLLNWEHTAVSRKVVQQNRTRQCRMVSWVMGVRGP